MAGELRIGVIHSDGDLSQSIAEQRLGAKLAADYTREIAGANDDLPVVIERGVVSVDEVPIAARDLMSSSGCTMLLGAVNVPHSIRAAQWAEENGIVYATANNNPLVGGGRRHVFHIGVPSEITGNAVARFLVGERRATRVGLLHAGNEFQVHAANSTAVPLREKGAEVLQIQLDEDEAGDRAVLERLREWKPDGMMIYDSETDRQVSLVKKAHALGGLPPMVHARGMLCSEFRDGAGAAAEGHFFVDMFLRGDGAPDEEKALQRHLSAFDPSLIPTASHAFAWDELRLLALARQAAGPDANAQIAYLESLRSWQGSGGPLTFSESDHNGRWTQDPTTIAAIVNGQFTVISRLDR